MLALVAALVALAAAPQTAAAPAFEGFRTPSRNIGCLYAAQGRVLRCDIRSGLRPEPTRRCELDWTGLTLTATGRAAPTCAGDTAFDPRTPILGYGRTWRRSGISCLSQRTGLRCTNARGHGFFLARERWRVF